MEPLGTIFLIFYCAWLTAWWLDVGRHKARPVLAKWKSRRKQVCPNCHTRHINTRHSCGEVRQLTAADCRHPDVALVDVRSAGELVATLCTACDAQLGPEVWSDLKQRELETLLVEAPAPQPTTSTPVQHLLSSSESNGAISGTAGFKAIEEYEAAQQRRRL